MIANAWGVVLSRRTLGEADRLTSVYTETFGRLAVRFVGVDKPGRKLKALSEPMAWGEYRLYLSARSDVAKAVGGRLIGTFPGVRADFKRTVAALSCCGLMQELTPERAPNSDKYRLIVSALAALEEGAGPGVDVAFGLQLLELCGVPLPERSVAAADRPLWEELSRAQIAVWRGQNLEPGAASRLRGAVYDHAEAHSGRPFKPRAFAGTL